MTLQPPAIRAQQEIEELHRFFQDWFRGEAVEASLSRLEAALAPDFVLITPGGRVLDRNTVVTGVASQRGSDPAARLWIENVTLRQAWAELMIVTYEEWQERRGSAARGRLSTVVFGTHARPPTDLQWVHLHETWLGTPQEF
ncbi:MAG: DUF4440 domain-containing protein [Gemmatimonadota bacterium]